MNNTGNIWSVSRLTGEIKRLLEEGLPPIWLEGEISNYKLHTSGHHYFTLKDVGAQVPAVMWRTRPEPAFNLRDGLKVRVYGRVVVWEQGGRYQFDVYQVLPAGLGALQAAFEALKNKLAAEGLFSVSRKRPLPRFPNAIGIITSRTGAAIHDLAWGFANRFPPAKLYLVPVAVQGETAAREIAAAIALFNSLNLVDVLIIGRGGGALEDLWAFNEEIVVRAVVNSVVPVVSAVGHEVDVTLSDLAADVRAPTPTAAAAIVVPDRKELLEALQLSRYRLTRALERTLKNWRERIKSLSTGYGFRRAVGRVTEERMRLSALGQRIETAVKYRTERYRQRLDNQRERLRALSPTAVLERGYCLARRRDDSLARSAAELAPGEDLTLHFSCDRAKVEVLEIFLNAE